MTGDPTPAPQGAPAASESATERRRGRLLSTLVAGAIAGAAVSAPLTVLLDHQQTSAAAPVVADAAATDAPPSVATTSGVDVAAVLDVARPAVVAIRTELVSASPLGAPQRGEAAGSGFVIDPNGTIVTNSHVVEGAQSISVEFADGSRHDASVVAQDATHDLAVLKVDGSGFTSLELGSSSDLRVGDPVVAIGNALGLDGDLTVTTGIVSAKQRDVDVGANVLRDMIQTDAAINPGNSGGPLVDAEGRVVGINSAGARNAQSIGFAIPIDDALPVIRSLERGEVPARPFLGVQTTPITGQVRAQTGVDATEGALVVDVTPGSAAEHAGVRAGDVITGFDGSTVTTPSDLGDLVAAVDPGKQTTLTVDRLGQQRTLTITVGTRPGSVS